jgi:hypothetical protein
VQLTSSPKTHVPKEVSEDLCSRATEFGVIMCVMIVALQTLKFGAVTTDHMLDIDWVDGKVSAFSSSLVCNKTT